MIIRHSQTFVDNVSSVNCETADSSGIVLPEPLYSNYKVLSCLKYSEQSATYLVKQISSDKTALMKTTGDFLFSETLINEANILDFLHQQNHPLADGFPKNLDIVQTTDTYYYVRTYIEGKTLEEICESNLKKPGISPSLALNYVIQLTELLHFLHGLKPPVIHRDIKPQNIVVDSNGICHCIDMGISRFFDKAKKSDTVIMGTRLTAPPEQFGYHQTDIRSDLYSLGIVLYYCITGEYEIHDQHLAELEPSIQKIIKKATMFDPDKRYQSTEELLPDLLAARYPLPQNTVSDPPVKHSSWKKRSAFLFFLNLLLAAALFWQYHYFSQTAIQEKMPLAKTSANTASDPSDVYSFQEPLIEEAVRKILNIPDAPITEADLAKITSLHIMGLQIFNDDSEIWFQGEYPYSYNSEYRESNLFLQQGPISSLEDIAHMPNLSVLSLYKQQITDISLLKNRNLTHIGLAYNPISDFSSLEGSTSVQSLTLADVDLSDIKSLSTLPNLERLNISGTSIQSIKGLENCSIKELDLFQVNLKDYSELQNLSSLETLVLDYMNTDILTTISSLPLKDLVVRRYQNILLDDFSIFPQLESLTVFGHSKEEAALNLPQLPTLKELELNNLTISDFKSFSSLSSLETLKIFGAEVKSFEGLDQLPNLTYISSTAEQETLFNTQYPESNFIFMY